MPVISIIIPVYNVADYLDRCLESVVNQTYKELEIILVDDGSTDNSGKICDSWAEKDKRIIVIHQKNAGLSAARNTGIDNSTGEYIGFIDSDDYVETDMYEKMLNAMTAAGSDMCTCGILFENSDTVTKKNLIAETTTFSSDECLTLLFTPKSCMPHYAWNKLYKAKLFKTARYPVGKLYEDYATTYKIVEDCDKITTLSACLYHYIYRNVSISNNVTKRSISDYISFSREICDHYASSPIKNNVMNQKLTLLSKLWVTVTKIKNNESNVVKKIIRNELKIDKKYFRYVSKRQRLIAYCIIYAPFILSALIFLRKKLLHR